MRTRTGASICLFVVTSILTPAIGGELRADELGPWEHQIAEHPDDGHAYEGYAIAAMGAKRWDDAIAKLRAAVARMPSFGRGYYLLAVAHRSKGDWPAAAGNYRKCIELRSQENDARFGLAKALVALGDRSGAAEALRRYVADENDPMKARFVETARADLAALERDLVAGQSPAMLRAEADKLKAAGKLDEAVAAYRRAVAAAPSDALLRNELGTALFALKRYLEAAEAFAAATERDGSYAVAWFNLGSALRKADRPAEAMRAGNRYVELLPADPDGWYALAQSREAAGDERGAGEAYRRFISIESRPGQQRYVDKAREALAALETRQRAGAMGLKPIEHDDVLPMAEAGRRADLRDPFDAAAAAEPDAGGTIDPFGRAAGARDGGGSAATSRAREYLSALSAYRHALAAHAERVSARYEKGVALAVSGKLREATATWDGVPLEDPQLVAARRQLERVREKK